MTQRCESAFIRWARAGVLAAVMAVLGVSTLLAQAATGKIEGRVRDQAGAPIANAQVFIVGTTFQAQTSPQGYYFINNVPIGTMTLQAGFIGYKSTQVTNVRVLGDQTITQDITLESTPFVVEDLVVTRARTPLVPRDEVTTKQRVEGAYVENLPVDNITNVLALQPGVIASQSGNTIQIRGGRTDENAVYIDGIPVMAGQRGTGFVNNSGNAGLGLVGTQSFEEASITTGSASAEFGNAQSGIISITTRTGGPTYAGAFSYETDEPFGTGMGYGYNKVTAAVSGPIAGALTFSIGGGLVGQQSNVSGQDREKVPIFIRAGVDTTVAVPTALGNPLADTTFVDVEQYAIYTGECDQFANSVNSGIANNYGLDCRGVRLPGQGQSSYNLTGKLNYTYGTGSRFSVSGYLTQNQSRADYDQSNPQDQFATRTWNKNVLVNWTQNLSKSAERALALEVFGSYQQDNYIFSPLTRESDFSSFNPFGGFYIKPYEFLFDFDNFPLNDALLDNFKNNTPGTRRSPFDLEDIDQYRESDNYRNNAQSILGVSETGGPEGRLALSTEDRYIVKANLDWQVDRYNRIKLGGEHTWYKIKNYSHQLTSQAFSDFYMEEPIRYNLYIQDRLDLGDVVLEGGLRYDYYDSKAMRPYLLDLDPVSPTFNEYIYFPRTHTYVGQAPDGRELTIFRQDESHDYLSPHIQVAFPVTERTNFRLSYAHQVQTPDFGLIFGGVNTDLQITNTNNVYGSDLDFGRTITFEFGIRHSFNDDMVLDIAAYNKDNIENAAGRLIRLTDPLKRNIQDIRLMTNADFGNTKGIDIRLDRRFGNLFNGTVSYTFQDAKNTGSDPRTYINFGSRIVQAVTGGNQPPPQAILPIDNSRPHNLAGSFALTFPDDWKQGTGVGSIFENVGVFATFRVASGTAFTRCPAESGNEAVFSGQVCSREFAGDQNGARLPTFKQFDVRVTKGFQLRGVDVTAYVDARNIFNFENITGVFTTTNDVVSVENNNRVWRADSGQWANEANRNGWLDPASGTIDLTFGTGVGNQTGMCGTWTNQAGVPNAPNCVYMIRAEQRYGNGDGLFTLAELRAASDAAYNEFNTGGFRAGGGGGGLFNFTGPPRNIRVGVELNF